MRFKYYYCILLVFLLSSNAYAEERWLCIAEQSSGFKYNKSSKSWVSTTFITESKYIISGKDGKFFVKDLSNNLLVTDCKDGPSKSVVIDCKEGILFKKFTFNKNNGRFILSSPFGYVVTPFDSDEKTDTPYMEIGKCSSF